PMAFVMPRNKHDGQSLDLADPKRRRRLAPGARDALFPHLLQARQIVESRTADYAQHRLGHFSLRVLFPDLHVDERPDPMTVVVIAHLLASRTCIDQPDRSLLADPERHAVGLEREDPIGMVNVFGLEIAGIAVHRHEADLYLCRFKK